MGTLHGVPNIPVDWGRGSPISTGRMGTRGPYSHEGVPNLPVEWGPGVSNIPVDWGPGVPKTGGPQNTVTPVLPREGHHRQQLTAGDAVPSLRLREQATAVSDDSLSAFIVDLRQYSPNPSVAGIRIQDKLTSEVGVGQDGGGSQASTKFIECSLTFVRPIEGYRALSQAVKWPGDSRKVFHKPPVIAGHPQELLHLPLGSGGRPRSYLFGLRRVGGYTITGDDMTQALDFMLEKEAFRRFEAETRLTESLESGTKISQVFVELRPRTITSSKETRQSVHWKPARTRSINR